MLRALAHRALGATSEWTEYVQASLKDSSRPPMERIEAFFHAYGLPTQRNYGSFSADNRILGMLDDQTLQALTEVLPAAAAGSERYTRASISLMSHLSNMEHPAITRMLLEALGSDGPGPTRGIAIQALRGRAGDPQLRAALEKIAAGDPDPQIRAMASNTLSAALPTRPATVPERGVSNEPAAQPPRLGVMTDFVQPGPGVTPDLVGKLAVIRMAEGMPAQRAGIREGDILLEIGGKQIVSGLQLIEVLDALQRDVDVEVVISRDGQVRRLTARF